MKKYRLLVIFIIVLGMCWGIRLIALIQPTTSFPLSLKWQTDLGYSTYEYPTYQDGVVYMPASSVVSSYSLGFFNSRWYAIEAVTGRIIWSQSVKQYSFLRCLTPEYLVLSGPWSFRVLEKTTGKIAWDERYSVAYSATCSEKSVFSSGVPRDSIAANELATGQRLWEHTMPRKSFGGLIYNPETNEIIAKETNLPGNMYIVEVESGLLKRSFETVAYAPTDRSWERGPVYIINRGQLFIGGTVLNAKTGEIIHKEERFKTNLPPSVTSDTMYLSANLDGVVAFDRRTYEVKWIYQPQPNFSIIPMTALSPVVVLDNIGYVIFSDSTLRAFALDTGQEIGYWQPGIFDLLSWPPCQFPPVPGCIRSARPGLAASDDTLFVSFGSGKLYAFSK